MGKAYWKQAKESDELCNRDIWLGLVCCILSNNTLQTKPYKPIKQILAIQQALQQSI